MNQHELAQIYRKKLEAYQQDLVAKKQTRSVKSDETGIAIVGISAYLPGAMNVEEFWKHLDLDKPVITEIPQSRFDWSLYYSADKNDLTKMRTKWGGFIPSIKMFDPAFFGILPAEAKVMDPQHKLLLMSAYQAIEDAGYASQNLRGKKIGVYVGIEDNEYLEALKTHQIDLGLNGLNHHPSMAANRISYFFDFRGPSQIINTMCSSTATAIYYAKQALDRNEIEMAVVSGARIILNPQVLVGLSKLNVLSTKNTVLSFGENADGYVRAEGVITVVLKKRSEAERDHNHIYAIIKNAAINYNGRGGSSIAAPHKESHVEVIKQCYAGADIRKIEYIEAQGMGNPVADLVEWESLNTALKQMYQESEVSYTPGYCKISTLKPMMVHIECVSSLGALLKIIRSFHTNTIHPIINLDQLNPHLNVEGMPCELLKTSFAWNKKNEPRLAGLHSYGSGGNNAHLLIEEYLSRDRSVQTLTKDRLIVLSAPTEEQVDRWVKDLIDYLPHHTVRMDDLEFTLQVGRNSFEYRVAFIAKTIEELISNMNQYLNHELKNPKIFKGKGHGKAVDSIHKTQFLSQTIEEKAKVWVGGQDLSWVRDQQGEKPYRVSLPKMPFNLKEYWALPGVNNSQESNKKLNICIIGAGPAGLVMAKSLLEEGHCPDVYEEKGTIGGLWALNNSAEKKNGAYQNTKFQSSRFTSVFSDFYPEKIKSNFYTVNEVMEYLNLYSKEYNLNSHITLNSKVISVEEKNRKWEVVVSHNGQEIKKIYDGVAMCQGSFTDPYVPEKQGLNEFKGKIMHSGEYYNNKLFENKRVLVIGNGVSAMDIADEASEVAKEVFWSRRSNKLILPRMVGFVPNDCQSPASLLVEENRTNIIERLRQSMPEYFKIYENSGILPTFEEFSLNPIVHINDHVVKKVAEKKITVKNDIAAFYSSGCMFEDELQQAHEVDIIVFCTGYKNIGNDDTRFNYLKNIKVLDDFSMGIFYKNNFTLVNTSVLPIAYTGSFYYMEMIARWYSQMLSGKLLLTNEEINSRITDAHYLIMAPISSVLFGIRLGLFPDPRKEFKKFWKLLNYPAFPMIHRLRGFHTYPQAEAMLEEFSKKSYIKTDANDDQLKLVKYRILAALSDDVLSNLLLASEIDQNEYEQALLHRSNPLILDWDSQYIKKNLKALTADQDEYHLVKFQEGLEKIVAEILQIEPEEIDIYKHLSEYGFDSITLTGLAHAILNQYPLIHLEPSVFLEHTTIHQLSQFVFEKYKAIFLNKNKKISMKKNKFKRNSFQLLKKGTKDIKTFWFHAAFGTTQVYQPIAQLMKDEISFYAMHSLVKEEDLTPCSNIEEMSHIYASLLMDNFDDPSFHLAGYSQGGVIAHEVARYLMKAGRRVQSIIMVDAPFSPITTYMTKNMYYLLIIFDMLSQIQTVNLAEIDLAPLATEDLEIDLDTLVDFCIKFKIPYSKKQLKSILSVHQEILSANSRSMENHIIKPLENSDCLSFHYFRRKHKNQYFQDRLFLNKYVSLQNKFYKGNNCLERWKNVIPDLHIHKTEAEDHFSFFKNEEILTQIAQVCHALYMQESPVKYKIATEYV